MAILRRSLIVLLIFSSQLSASGVRHMGGTDETSVSLALDQEWSTVHPHAMSIIGKLAVNMVDHARDYHNEHVLTAGMEKRWKDLDPQLWVPKYVCFVRLQMVLWLMSRSSLVTETDVCTIGTDVRLKEKLFLFAQKSDRLADRLILSKTSNQKKDSSFSQALISEAGVALTICDKLISCFLESAWGRGATFGGEAFNDKVFSMAHEVEQVFRTHTAEKMDHVGMALAEGTKVERPGGCNESATWAQGAWKIGCRTAAACEKVNLTAAAGEEQTYMIEGVSKQSSYVFWTQFSMKVADQKDWLIDCLEGEASRISVDGGKHWFKWTGMKYLYVAEFSDAKEKDHEIYEGTRLNAYIQKVD